MRDPALLIIRLARTDGTDWVVKYNEVLGWRVPGVLIITYRKLHLSLIVPARPVIPLPLPTLYSYSTLKIFPVLIYPNISLPKYF